MNRSVTVFVHVPHMMHVYIFQSCASSKIIICELFNCTWRYIHRWAFAILCLYTSTSPTYHTGRLNCAKQGKPKLLSAPLSTHHILHLSTESDTVLEHAGQRDCVGESQPHQSSIQGTSQRDGGEGYGGQEHPADKVDPHSKPACGHQVQVPALGVLVLEPGHNISIPWNQFLKREAHK